MNLLDKLTLLYGLPAAAQVGHDVLTGQTPPWWAQFGAAILISVGVIYLLIKYLAPKLDQIDGNVKSILQEIQRKDRDV